MTIVKFEHPFYPIIYVRGYAGTQGEVEDTVSDPYMGFNTGSTKMKQAWTGDLQRFYFESPLVRLMKDHGYTDVYEGGDAMPLATQLKQRSIIIYRYYDSASKELGEGRREEIESYAKGLGRLILSIYDRFKIRLNHDPSNFRVNLVAHSMGGLVCRCFLQNRDLDDEESIPLARSMVDKVFTYATPHNGIDLKVLGNLPSIFTKNNMDNFNRKKMREYLSLESSPGDDNASSLGGRFDPNRFFCLVGTSPRDYDAAGGLAAKAVGPMSDGLVRISNATVWGPGAKVVGKSFKIQSPRAFVYRSHSGPYGIVNSEEGYQNLTRFLFGDIRVDGKLILNKITLPHDIQKRREEGKKIRASYHIEAILRVRGKRWDLHRRVTNEGSAIFRTFDEIFRPPSQMKGRHPHIFSAFLSSKERINRKRKTLGFSLDLRVLVPEYEVDGFLFMDKHYEGGYLYRDKINLEALPPDNLHVTWRMRYGLDSKTPNRSTRTIEPSVGDSDSRNGSTIFEIPIWQRTNPGIDATLRIEARAWNTDTHSDEGNIENALAKESYG